MDFAEVAFIFVVAFIGRALWKYYHTAESITIDRETKDMIDELSELKAQHSEILQFIFDYDTHRDNVSSDYTIKWSDITGKIREATIWHGTGKHNTDKMYRANLKKSAEAYEKYLSERIDEKINQLYRHHSKNVKSHGSLIWNSAKIVKAQSDEQTKSES